MVDEDRYWEIKRERLELDKSDKTCDWCETRIYPQDLVVYLENEGLGFCSTDCLLSWMKAHGMFSFK